MSHFWTFIAGVAGTTLFWLIYDSWQFRRRYAPWNRRNP